MWQAWPVAKYLTGLVILLLLASNTFFACRHFHALSSPPMEATTSQSASVSSSFPSYEQLHVDASGGSCPAGASPSSSSSSASASSAFSSGSYDQEAQRSGGRKQQLAKLQEARTKSLHRALEKMVARSDKK